MPYVAPNTKLPSAFSADREKKNNKPRYHDYFAEVVSYDPAHGALIGKRIDDGQIFELTVRAAKVTRALDSAKKQKEKGGTTADDAGSWNGALIDANMAAKVPPGSIIEVEAVTFQKEIKVGNEKRFVVEGNWVHHVPDDNVEKLLRGPITGVSYQNRMTQAQHWSLKAFSTSTAEGEENINKLADEMDANVANYNPEEFKPRQGVQFRSYIDAGKTREVKVYEGREAKTETRGVVQAVGASFCYDWFHEDAQGDQDAVSRPLSGDEMVSRLSGYQEYIASLFPGQNVITEVLHYKGYKTSNTDNTFDVKPDGFNYTAKNMVSTPMRLGVGEDEPYFTGRNYAVRGALMLVKDKVAKGKIIKQYLAARLFTNGWHGPLLEQIPTEDGKFVELHPDMKPAPRPDRAPANQDAPQNTGGAAASAPRFESTLTPNDEADPFDVGGSDPYGAAFTAPAASSAASAPAPAASAPAAEPEPAAAPEAPASEETTPPAGRLRRRLGQ